MKYSGSGLSPEDPIVVSDVANHIEAVMSEYAFLENRYGTKGTMWTLKTQTLLEDNDRMIDRMEIRLKTGEIVTLYFDITKYFGQF